MKPAIISTPLVQRISVQDTRGNSAHVLGRLKASRLWNTTTAPTVSWTQRFSIYEHPFSLDERRSLCRFVATLNKYTEGRTTMKTNEHCRGDELFFKFRHRPKYTTHECVYIHTHCVNLARFPIGVMLFQHLRRFVCFVLLSVIIQLSFIWEKVIWLRKSFNHFWWKQSNLIMVCCNNGSQSIISELTSGINIHRVFWVR